MNVATLITRIRKYLQDSTLDADFIVQALNGARKSAELLHDWEQQKVVARLSVSPTVGALLSAAVLDSDGVTSVDIKSVHGFYLRTDSGDTVPVPYASKQHLATWRREELRDAVIDTTFRYLPVSNYLDSSRQLMVYMFGPRVFVDPQPSATTSIVIDAQMWEADWTDSTLDSASWWLKRAHDYLFWQAICELNYITKTFVPRSDGDLSPPEKYAAQKLQELIQWDDFANEGARQPERPR